MTNQYNDKVSLAYVIYQKIMPVFFEWIYFINYIADLNLFTKIFIIMNLERILSIIASLIGIGLFLALIITPIVIRFARVKIKTIKMNKPLYENNKYQRRTFNDSDKEYLHLERNLREKAYSKTDLEINDAFLDDSDMSSEYLLVLALDRDNKPILSARVYWDISDIKKEIEGDNPLMKYKMINPVDGQKVSWTPNELTSSEEGSCFLVDRMSRDETSDYYVQKRDKIYYYFYNEIYKKRKNAAAIYALARRCKNEKLLTKYLRIGMTIIGTTSYCGVEHWVLVGKYSEMKNRIKVNSLLLKIFKWLKI